LPKSHNKKRNVGIVYELLLRRVSECLINEDTAGAQKTLDIISNRFKKGTELYREFRLFRALAKSHVSDTSVAAAIITEAKSAARKTNTKKLEKEKSSLIREMNYTLRDSNLYRRYVPDYKSLATIQVLLNDWRDGDGADIQRMAMYESKIIQHLLEEKSSSTVEDHTNPDVDSLVVKIMSEKLNKKYSEKFDKDQRDILNLYSFSLSSENRDAMKKMNSKLKSIKTESLEMLDTLESSSDNDTISQKISTVREKIINESVENIDDSKVVRFLTLIDLCKEIKESI
tara:strand:- start:1800 stop:2657 length:858 start_codon:yes stop_codon:yes gene_type:complete